MGERNQPRISYKNLLWHIKNRNGGIIMVKEFEASEITEEHRMIIDPVGFISEIINNIGDQRDIIRELLSNAAAKEVGATKVDVRIYESDMGLAITVVDDGCGMNYTRNDKKPGRLDKFLNAAQGKQAGFESDEFGAKGLGTKLLYNSDYVEIETYDGGEYWYRVVLDKPYKTVMEDKKLATPVVHTIRAAGYPGLKKGTKITVKGWARLPSIPRDFKIDRTERYLRYYTVIGYTRMTTRHQQFPEFTVSVGGQRKILNAGFPFITAEEKTDDIKTLTFGPIETEKKTSSGKTVKILLKGGITTDTGKFQLTEETGGVWLSVNGIPYFKLATNKYARKLNLTDDFVRFVVECDDVRLNMSRSDFSYDENYDAFEDALNEAFNRIKEDQKFQKFYQNRRRELRIELQTRMNQKKEEFSSEDKRYVWYKEKMLVAEPESEYDTAALLWILEGLGALPFAKFQTLQYPGYREGVDLLVDYQEEKDTEEHKCAYVELERLFSNFIRHKHEVGQMSLAFCWRLDKGKVTLGKINATKKPYKHTYTFGDTTIPVFEIGQFPGIFVGTKKEAKEHFKNQSSI
jgi:hypothetical protein